MKTWLAVFTAAVLFSLIPLTAAAQQRGQNPPPPPLTVQKVRDDLYVIGGEGSNITVYITDEGLVLVDDKFERNYDEVQSKLRSFTDKPVKYIINTHPHGDHTGGNAKFQPAAQVIGHVNARAAMIKGKQPGLPQLTYTDEMRLSVGGKEVIIRHYAPCHTDGDTLVYFPAARVLATGDCFNTGNGQGVNTTGSPTFAFYIDYNTGGSFFGRQKVGDAIINLDFDTAVPGHGPTTNKAGVQSWRDQMVAIRNRVGTMLREGKTKADIEKVLISEFGWEPGGRALAASLDPMMNEIRQAR